MNNVNLIGRIATDVKAGNGVISTLLAVKRIYKSKDGQDTDFIPLSVFPTKQIILKRWLKKDK